jgi:hypothetical protein
VVAGFVIPPDIAPKVAGPVLTPAPKTPVPNTGALAAVVADCFA